MTTHYRPESFKAELDRLVREKVTERADKLVRGVARTLANEMSLGGTYSPGTPVKTGFHRSHWDAEVGALPAGGSVGGKESPDPFAAHERMHQAIDELKTGETLYMTNNAPGIRRLEFDGWSLQAPDGFVRVAAAAIQPITDEVAAHVLADA